MVKRIRRRRPRPTKYATLADYLARSGHTQKDVAHAVGTSQAYVSMIASGRVNPNALLSAALANYCDVPLDSFLREHLDYLARGAAAVPA
jgi:transcriptional regulator with XRE-family HTH domain